MKRGRIPKIDSSIVIDIILKYKEVVLLPNDKIISKTNPIWMQISEELDRKKSSASLYSFVCDNKYGIRDLLNNRKVDIKINNSINLNDSSSTINSTIENDSEENSECVISMPRQNFDNLIIEKVYKGRRVKKLSPGLWQREISERLWNNTRMHCGFNFKWHHISNDMSSGSIHGK